ncbi:MAG: hypothetical protein ACI9MB_000969, partial [Verrucomicrobiales bacterium]
MEILATRTIFPQLFSNQLLPTRSQEQKFYLFSPKILGAN